MVEVLLVGLSVLGFAMVSGRLTMAPLTAPMVFTTIGLVVGVGGLGWFDLDLRGEAVSVLVEATLVLVLFTDAIRIDLGVLRRQALLPGRLLGLGMPLTVLAGTGVALLVVPDLGLAEAALLAAVLAPTDAALGQAVVSDQRLPARVRQALNVESGLNDGIAVPIVTVLLAAVVAEDVGGASDWVTLATEQVGYGVAVGLVVGLLGGWLLDRRVAAGAVEGVYRQLAALSIAACAYALSSVLDGNGFIAAFVAGLAFGRVARRQCSGVQDFSEDEGELLSAVTFLIFGAVVVGPALDQLSWRVAVYVVCSLTVVRMVPVLLALLGSGTRWRTRLFLGWFGPRGLASILFALLVAEGTDSAAGETIFAIAAWTVLVSVFAHGVTAAPWAGHLGRYLKDQPVSGHEMGPAPELPTRRRLAP